jgi:leucyl-tRNA synthetase
MTHIHNLKHLGIARKLLRKDLTLEEKKLWFQLRNNSLGCRFRRQHSIGNFIADFFCVEKRLVIEIDGGQHLDNKESDQERTDFFDSLGIEVIRFWNSEVRDDIDEVITKIKDKLSRLP